VRISGSVREGGTGVIIGGAELRCANQPAARTSADERGRFALRAVADGLCELEVGAQGYHRRRRAISLAPREAVTTTVYLTPTARNRQGVVVHGRKEEVHMTRRILDAEELTRVPGTLGDPIRAVTRLPGVARGSFLDNSLMVRGAAAQDTGFYVDGQPVVYLFHLSGQSILHPDMVEQIEFMPGGFGAYYGRATAGIIDVKTRPANGERFSGKVDVDLLDAGLRLEGPVKGRKDLAFAFSGRRSYIDQLLPPVMAAVGAGSRVQVHPVYWDYNLRLDWKGKSGGERAGLRLYGADDVLVLRSGDTETAARSGGFPGIGTHSLFHRLALDWRKKLSKKTRVKTALHLGTINNGGEIGDGDIFWDIGYRNVGLRADLQHEFSKNLVLDVGTDSGAQFWTAHTRFPAVVTIERNFPTRGFSEELAIWENTVDSEGVAGALHSTLRAKPHPRLLLLPGLRVEKYAWMDQQRLSTEPRFSARWSSDKRNRHQLKVQVGQYRKLPNPELLSDNLGNRSMELEGAWQYGAGYEFRPDPFLHLDVQVFYKKMYNIVGNNRTYSQGGDQPRLDNLIDGRVLGAEFLLRHRPSPRPVYGWIAYTLSRSERRHRQYPEFGWYLFGKDQTHIFNAVVGFKFGHGWTAGTTLRLVSGDPTYPVTAARFDTDVQVYRELRSGDLDARTPTFFQMDVRIEKKSSTKRHAFMYYLDLMNATNAENIEFIIHQYDYRASSGIAGVPIFPSFGIEWSW
jgi:outer membrane receptor protein involved in Fe transport